MRLRFRIQYALLLVILIAVAAFLRRPLQQARAAAAVQDSLDRAWEITFESSGAPADLPDWLDDSVSSLLRRVFANTQGYNGSSPAAGRNRDEIHIARFQALFRDPVEFIGIYYPEGLRGDQLGTALALFPRLRRLEIFENEGLLPTEADWKKLCARLPTLLHLEEIELGGTQLTDAAIAGLAGHSRLRHVHISLGQLTPACITTFAALPHLRNLVVGEMLSPTGRSFSEKDWATMMTALPLVTFTFE